MLLSINSCTRCGKERILARVWEEEVDTFRGKTKIKHSLTVCPDPDCQKIIDAKNLELKQKSDDQKRDREQRIKNMLEQRALNKKSNIKV